MLEQKEIEEIPVAAEVLSEEVKSDTKEEQDKQPENLDAALEASTEVAKVEDSEEKTASNPLEIIRTAKNKYQFVGDIAPKKEETQEEKDKLALALTNGLPETFEDELFDWPEDEDLDPVYREIFEKLQKKENRLKDLEGALAKKDNELVVRA